VYYLCNYTLKVFLLHWSEADTVVKHRELFDAPFTVMLSPGQLLESSGIKIFMLSANNSLKCKG